MNAATEFLERFRLAHGRAPRVLHIGNVANNAYLNAKLLNRAGFDCDVLCSEYYHIMGCPEWEDVDFDGTVGDHFRPDWTRVDLHGYERPRWFAQGPRELCIDYLIARRTGQHRRAEALWKKLGRHNRTRPGKGTVAQRLSHTAWFIRRVWDRFHNHPAPDRLVRAILARRVKGRGEAARRIAAAAEPVLVALVLLARLLTFHSVRRPLTVWPARFAEAFPDRTDRLTDADCDDYLVARHRWKKLFEHYDIVQAYATDVIHPMLAEKRPYLGFEHGTLRVFTLADNALSRLTALGYHRADHVFITNGDCLEYAHKIKVASYTPIPHPFDDAFMRDVKADREEERRKYGVDYVFLCPLRHDWEIKGTDKYIRALPDIAERIGRRFRVVMTRWGQQVEESEQLARSLGVDGLIVWSEPFNRVQLIRQIRSADVVFDQIALPCFGGTAPQAIACGTPVIMSYDPASTEWLIPEPAPILSAWNIAQIVAAVTTALDPAWRTEYERVADRWYRTYHGSDAVVQKHAEAYMRACEKAGLVLSPPAAVEVHV